jgi:hypothetical protein
MVNSTLQEIVDGFTSKIQAQLDPDKLDGPVRLDPTRSMVIIPLKGKGPIHVETRHQINDEGVQGVIGRIRLVPSLQGIVRTQ